MTLPLKVDLAPIGKLSPLIEELGRQRRVVSCVTHMPTVDGLGGVLVISMSAEYFIGLMANSMYAGIEADDAETETETETKTEASGVNGSNGQSDHATPEELPGPEILA